MRLQFFKLFKSSPSFALGAIPSPEDKRNIALASFQKPVPLPDEFETILPYVRNQGAKGKCVGCAISTLTELYLGKKGIIAELSDDDLYDQAKTIDGIPDIPGTYPAVGAKVACKNGIASVEAFNSKDPVAIAESRLKHKLGSYAYVSADFDSIAQAIYQNGAVTACIEVDTNFFMGIILRVLKSLGKHYIVLKGAKVSNKTLKARNSWGTSWIGYIAGQINPAVKPGEFEMAWSDMEGNLTEIIAFADVPPEILKVVTDKPYYFKKPLKRGDTGLDVLELQKRLDKEGFWDKTKGFLAIYGPATAKAVLLYQLHNNLITKPTTTQYGDFCGPMTIRSLNKETKLSLIDAIIQVESEGNDWAIGDKNLLQKAYGPMQIRQPACDDINKAYGGNYQAKDCLGNRDRSIAIFGKYMELYNRTTDEMKARQWNGGAGGVLYPSRTDAYWNKVKSFMQ